MPHIPRSWHPVIPVWRAARRLGINMCRRNCVTVSFNLLASLASWLVGFMAAPAASWPDPVAHLH